MQENERVKYVRDEIEAIFEDFDDYVNKLLVIRDFLKDVSTVAKGAEPTCCHSCNTPNAFVENNTNCK